MKERYYGRFIGKALLYAVLLAGSAVFMLPLAWMVSTALKPIEQTMA
ncbi:MAG TPA: carbohydrate ABC transporter permease, partial [Lentisphaerae bacterium]|nr:carbohydrate ABC transporter permease [Lentisphaerota bacterium]